MLRLNTLLKDCGIDPRETAICLHTPRETKLAKMFPYFAETQPEMVATYQATHGENATATLSKSIYMASFIRVASGTRALFEVYRNLGIRQRRRAELARIPQMRRLIEDFKIQTEFHEANAPDRPCLRPVFVDQGTVAFPAIWGE